MTTKLKITAIKPYPVWVGTRNQMLVKVETDNGIFGWGESGLSGREKAVAGAIEHYREFLIGRDAMQIGRIWQEVYRSQYFEGGRVLQAAISAIDIALHDIKGKALGVPAYDLLGGKQRVRIPTFASTGDEAEGDVAIERARELRAQGWQAIRFFPIGQNSKDIFEPRRSIGTTASMLNKAREALGDDVVLGIDYHHRLSVAEAASFCNKLGRGVLDILEEPIRDETPGSLQIPAHDDRHSIRHRRGICQQVAVPAPYRARHPSVQPARCVQCWRTHRSDEGGWLERSALCGPDAAQSPWPSLHGRDHPSRCRCAEFRLARDQAPEAKLGFDNSDFFPCSHGSTAPTIRSAICRGSASRSMKRRSRRRAFASGKRLT